MYDTEVPANGTIQNALTGGPIATAPYHGILNVYGRQEDTAAGKLRVDIMVGTEMVGQNLPMTRDDKLSPNRTEDHMGSWPVVQGTALIATIREISGAAMDLNLVFDFEQKQIEELIALAGG